MEYRDEGDAMRSDPPAREPGFLDDVGAAWRVWLAHPLLPLITAVLWLPSLLPGALGVLALPFGLFLLGWNGTQRIWYLRAFRGRSIDASEGWRFTWRFFGRHLVAALAIALPIMLVFMLPVIVGQADRLGDARTLPASIAIAAAVATLVLDVVLTFVMPALAFTTRRVTDAMGIGTRMLRAEWPRDAAYALVPPLALLSVSQATNAGWGPFAGLASLLIGLLMKGAIAAYYLRRHPVGDDGAVFVSPTRWEDVPPPPPPPL